MKLTVQPPLGRSHFLKKEGEKKKKMNHTKAKSHNTLCTHLYSIDTKGTANSCTAFPITMGAVFGYYLLFTGLRWVRMVKPENRGNKGAFSKHDNRCALEQNYIYYDVSESKTLLNIRTKKNRN